MNPSFHDLKVKEVRRETEDAVSVLFDVEEGLAAAYAFKPGQYLTLRAMIDGEDVRRSYSICSGSNDGELRVAIKEVPEGRFSTFANRTLRAGDQLAVMTPMGNFTTPIDATTKKSFVFFAAGSGITPMLSLTKSILKNAPLSNVTLVYGNKGTDSVIFKEVKAEEGKRTKKKVEKVQQSQQKSTLGDMDELIALKESMENDAKKGK